MNAASGLCLRVGIVSNCWGSLLPAAGLTSLCSQALAEGFTYVELRQGALGECEQPAGSGPPVPEPGRLRALRARFPRLGLNLAVEAPFLSTGVDPAEPGLRRCIDAALALGGAEPVLRLVDLAPATAVLTDGQVRDLAASLAALAILLHERDGRLALENCRQPMSAMLRLLQAVRARLPEGCPAPSLCWDPANQALQALEAEDPAAFARSVPLADLFEFHFKQVRGGVVLAGMEEGDLDWTGILAAFTRRGYRGPALFELPAGPDIWDRLRAGREWVEVMIVRGGE